MEQDPWYKDGLHFKCTECGKCCSGAPGYVWLEEEEMVEIATFLQISLKDFVKKYVRKVNNRYSLVERKNGELLDCVFLKDKKCTIYHQRPKQCRTFPWWRQNLTSKESWEEVAKECEGINNQVPVIPLFKIKENIG